MRIALVDNDPSLGELFMEVCKQQGVTGTHIRSGGEAVSELLKHYADVTIVDLGLPDLAGTAVIRQIRRNEGTFKVKPTKIIVYTGYDMGGIVGQELEKMLSRSEIDTVVSKAKDLPTLLEEVIVH